MNNFTEIREKYLEKVISFTEEYQETPSKHVIDIMVSIMMTRDDILMGGSFVKSLVDDKLFDSINLADRECLHHLKLLTLTNRFCFV